MHLELMNDRFRPPPGPRSMQCERLEWARETAKDGAYPTPTDAARAMDIPTPTYLGHENGSVDRSGQGQIPRDAAIRYADFFKVSLNWLLTGKGVPRGKGLAQVVGYVIIGGEVDLNDTKQHLELVELPIGVDEDCEALKVRGNAMYPHAAEGWLIFFAKRDDKPLDTYVDKYCVVQVSDGPMVVGWLRRGSTPVHFTIEPINTPPRRDAAILWASPVLSIKQPI